MWYIFVAFLALWLGWLACAILTVAKWADEAVEAHWPRQDDDEAIDLCD